MLLELPLLFIILATSSRKGIVSILLGLILVIYFHRLYRGEKVYTAGFRLLIGALVVLVCMQFLLQLPFFAGLNETYMGLISQFLGKTSEIDLSTAVRFNMLTNGWNQFLKTPVLGIGMDNGKQLNYQMIGWAVYLHNNYIELLVGGGMIAFLLHYGMLTMLIVKHSKRLKEHDPIVIISFIMLILRLVNDWGGVSYYDYSIMLVYPFWIAVANGFDAEGKTAASESLPSGQGSRVL